MILKGIEIITKTLALDLSILILIKGSIDPKVKIQSSCTHPHVDGKFLIPQNISGAAGTVVQHFPKQMKQMGTF